MLANWDKYFPECEPLAHLMRDRFRSRWVRFHSLPESKRYPENEEEMQTILARHNTILGEMLEQKTSVVLLTTGYAESADPPSRYPELLTLDPTAVSWREVAMHKIEGGNEQYYWHISASLWEWQPGTFDPLVRLVAEDQIANVMMVHPDCKWILHPYDGGMDVILESNAARQRLKSAHLDWLSDRPDGL